MARVNLFLAPPPEVAARVDALTARFDATAGLFPASLQTDDTSHYHRAAGSTVEETQRQLLRRTSELMLIGHCLGWAGVQLSPRLVLDVHEALFGPIFGPETLGYRQKPARGEFVLDDGVEFPVWVRGPQGRGVRSNTFRGARGAQVEKRMKATCRAFEAAVDSAVGLPDRAAIALAQLYARLIRIHPFGDGNGRTAWVTLQLAAGRLEMPLVKSAPSIDAKLALGDALLNGQKLEPLAHFIRVAAYDDEG